MRWHLRAISKKLRKVLVGLGQRIDFLSHARPQLPAAVVCQGIAGNGLIARIIFAGS
jgi:hypothetical protein